MHADFELLVRFGVECLKLPNFVIYIVSKY